MGDDQLVFRLAIQEGPGEADEFGGPGGGSASSGSASPGPACAGPADGHAASGDAPLKIVYLENYDWALGAALTSGVDIWLNTPRRPYEASGTSGMKAALNGVPSLSTMDGWWIEGHVEGVTGWSIAEVDDEEAEANSMYDKLDRMILPLYRVTPHLWHEVMRSTIALNGSFFNTHRMAGQYAVNAYFPTSHQRVETPQPVYS